MLLLFLVFICYFSSESLLREAAARGVLDKGVGVDDVVSKLPEGVRGSVEYQIDLAVARDALDAAKTEGEEINALFCLAMLKGRKEFEKANAKVLDEYPDALEARSAYSFFLLARKGALRNVSPERYRAYVMRLPEESRLDMWILALRRFNETGYPAEKVFDFFSPLFDKPTLRKDYEPFFMELAEFAFRNDLRYWEGESKRLEDACSRAPLFMDEANAPSGKVGGH